MKQSSAFITWSNTTWYCIHHFSDCMRQNILQSFDPQKTQHSSPYSVSYGVSFMRILEKIDCIITAPNCGSPGDIMIALLAVIIWARILASTCSCVCFFLVGMHGKQEREPTPPPVMNKPKKHVKRKQATPEPVEEPPQSAMSNYEGKTHGQCYVGQVTKVCLSCYLVLLSNDSKTR